MEKVGVLFHQLLTGLSSLHQIPIVDASGYNSNYHTIWTKWYGMDMRGKRFDMSGKPKVRRANGDGNY